MVGATKYLGQFPVHLFTDRHRAEWGNQKPLEETGRALGLERDTSPHGKDWHSMWIHRQAWKARATLFISAPWHLPQVKAEEHLASGQPPPPPTKEH